MKRYGQPLAEYIEEMPPEMTIIDGWKSLFPDRRSRAITEAVWLREERVKHSVLGD